MKKLLLNNLKNSSDIRRFKRRETIQVASRLRNQNKILIEKSDEALCKFNAFKSKANS